MTERTTIYCDGACYTAEDMRQINTALVCGEGVSTVAQGDLAVTAPGGNMSVNVAAGHAFIEGASAGEGMYLVYNDATVNRVLSNGGAQDRIDLVVAQLNGDCTWSVTVVQGTEAASPVAPTVPANAIPLAEVYVPALDTTVESGQITDRRTDFTACGGSTGDPTEVVYTADGSFVKADYPGARAFRVRAVGGGGAGGGSVATAAGQASAGAGGGSGAYGESVLLPSALPASVTVTVGVGGAGVLAAAGNPGTQSSFGALVTAPGGAGGSAPAASGSPRTISGVAGAAPGAGQVTAAGAPGGGVVQVSSTGILSGEGGSGPWGGGGRSLGAASNTVGEAGRRYGSGGSGAHSQNGESGHTGGSGSNGVVVVEVIV